jgi:hypothetical protein
LCLRIHAYGKRGDQCGHPYHLNEKAPQYEAFSMKLSDNINKKSFSAFIKKTLIHK